MPEDIELAVDPRDIVLYMHFLFEHIDAPEMIDNLYQVSFSRLPTAKEKARSLDHVNKSDNKQQALEDLLWVILNSKEFMFNH